jgi:hypothetical protein
MFLLVHDAQYVPLAMNETAGRFISRTAQVPGQPKCQDSPNSVQTALGLSLSRAFWFLISNFRFSNPDHRFSIFNSYEQPQFLRTAPNAEDSPSAVRTEPHYILWQAGQAQPIHLTVPWTPYIRRKAAMIGASPCSGRTWPATIPPLAVCTDSTWAVLEQGFLISDFWFPISNFQFPIFESRSPIFDFQFLRTALIARTALGLSFYDIFCKTLYFIILRASEKKVNLWKNSLKMSLPHCGHRLFSRGLKTTNDKYSGGFWRMSAFTQGVTTGLN